MMLQRQPDDPGALDAAAPTRPRRAGLDRDTEFADMPLWFRVSFIGLAALALGGFALAALALVVRSYFP